MLVAVASQASVAGGVPTTGAAPHTVMGADENLVELWLLKKTTHMASPAWHIVEQDNLLTSLPALRYRTNHAINVIALNVQYVSHATQQGIHQ